VKKEDYEKKLTTLPDPDTCRKLKQDPTSGTLRKTNRLIQQYSMDDDNRRKEKKSEALPPRIYYLP
jgi:hypothetical protein